MDRKVIWDMNMKWIKDEKGVNLVSSLIAVAMVGTAFSIMLAALSTGSIAVGTVEESVTAEGLARSQLEYTKNDTYFAAPYDYPTITAPQGYSVTAEALSVPGADSNIETIRVTVSKGGKTLTTLEDYKVNR